MSRVTRVARTAQLEGIRYWPLYSVQRDRCDKLRANMHFCSDPGACLSCSLIVPRALNRIRSRTG